MKATFQPDAPLPSVLAVPQSQAFQRGAFAELLRPGEVASIAAWLAPDISAGAPPGNLVAGWLRGFHYIPDPPGVDMWQSPLTTVTRGGGDCEDLALAGLSLLLALGCKGALVVGILWSRTGPIGHAWIEGWDSVSFFHIDATTGVIDRIGRPPNYIAIAVYAP